jgi:uncharacterized membrane protein
VASHAQQPVSDDEPRNLRLHTLWDGIFYSANCAFVVRGLHCLWHAGHLRVRAYRQERFPAPCCSDGAVNVVEGIVDQAVAVHHVNEPIPRNGFAGSARQASESNEFVEAALLRRRLQRRPASAG